MAKKTEETTQPSGINPAPLKIGETDADGFTAVGSWDLDGWFKIEAGRTIEGIVQQAKVGWDEDNARPTLTYVVQLTAPCIGKPVGEDELQEFPAGSCLGLSESFALRAIRDVVDKQSGVAIRCTPLERVKLKNAKRTMWRWDVRIKPGKVRPFPLGLDAKLSGGPPEDDEKTGAAGHIPF